MAYLLEKERIKTGKGEFIEFKVIIIPESEFFPEGIKYSMSFVKSGTCISRYDNERRKGHHRHFMGEESKIEFESIGKLKAKFLEEVKRLKR